MNRLVVSEAIKLLLQSLTSQEFKMVIDTLLDKLEGANNENQKAWHLVIRALLKVPDND